MSSPGTGCGCPTGAGADVNRGFSDSHPVMTFDSQRVKPAGDAGLVSSQ
jgi:hypothetical protein